MTGLSFFSLTTRSDPSGQSGAERSTSRTSSTSATSIRSTSRRVTSSLRSKVPRSRTSCCSARWSGRGAGIGRRFVLRTKPHLVAIRPAGGALALETLFFGDEVRDARRLAGDVEAVGVSEPELQLAEKLIETLKTTWDPDAYSDTYREELLERIAQKAPALNAEERAGDPRGSQVEALMDALKASVQEAKKRHTKRSAPKRTA